MSLLANQASANANEDGAAAEGDQGAVEGGEKSGNVITIKPPIIVSASG